jgi:phosphatidylserine/phosphatidylglycerophosphate/cardiolipin synthase-like enzyme
MELKMPDVRNVRAASNNEVSFISWDLDAFIPGCAGFEIVRIYPDSGEERCLASWVPFAGQTNEKWLPQDTGVWPVQKTSWRDLTLRRRRDSLDMRPSGERVKYRVRPVGKAEAGFGAVPVRPEKTYGGAAVPLFYLGAGAQSNVIVPGSVYGKARAAFTNGILSTQFLSRAFLDIGIDPGGKADVTARKIVEEMKKPGSKLRRYLHGEVPEIMTGLLGRAKESGGSVRMALYELGDEALRDALIAARDRIEVILSNSSKGDAAWDEGNAPFRQAIKLGGVAVKDRMFNNNHIGHNKFAVFRAANGAAKSVMTGSTNWTTTGICGQSNNALILDDAKIAKAYDTYWANLNSDNFPPPVPADAPGHAEQSQGVPLRAANRTASAGKGAKVWFSPNDPERGRKDSNLRPVDLADVFERIKNAKDAIFFLAFNPSAQGENSVISAALEAAAARPGLIVQGAISDAKAMPNYIAPVKDPVTKKTVNPGSAPYVFPDSKAEFAQFRNVSIVRAASLTKALTSGPFISEVLTVGHAIVHDKIILIDPASDNSVIVTGSHNLGYKASYENDENMLIIEGNRPLTAAYTVHFLDVFDHYKFRAFRHKFGKNNQELKFEDAWLKPYAEKTKGAAARYFP